MNLIEMKPSLALFLHKWFEYKPLVKAKYKGEWIYLPKSMIKKAIE